MEIIITPQYADLLTIDLSPCKQFLSHHLELFSVLEQQLPLYQHDLKVFLEKSLKEFKMTEFSTTCSQFITQELEKPFFKVTYETEYSHVLLNLINKDIETVSYSLKEEFNLIQQELNNRYFYLQELYNLFWNNQDPTYESIEGHIKRARLYLRTSDVLMTRLQSFNVKISTIFNQYKDIIDSFHNFDFKQTTKSLREEILNPVLERKKYSPCFIPLFSYLYNRFSEIYNEFRPVGPLELLRLEEVGYELNRKLLQVLDEISIEHIKVLQTIFTESYNSRYSSPYFEDLFLNKEISQIYGLYLRIINQVKDEFLREGRDTLLQSAVLVKEIDSIYHNQYYQYILNHLIDRNNYFTNRFAGVLRYILLTIEEPNLSYNQYQYIFKGDLFNKAALTSSLNFIEKLDLYEPDLFATNPQKIIQLYKFDGRPSTVYKTTASFTEFLENYRKERHLPEKFFSINQISDGEKAPYEEEESYGVQSFSLIGVILLIIIVVCRLYIYWKNL